MKYSFARTTIALALLAAAAYAGAATTQTWNLTTGDTTFRYENSITYENANRKKLTLTAYYADGINNVNQMVGDSVRTASLQSATRNAALKTTNSSGVWAGIGSFGGNGVGISNPVDTPATSGQENSNGGQHAIDNYDVYDTDVYNRSGSRIGRRNNVNMLSAQTHAHDFLLMDFKEVMELSTFRVSWKRFANTDIDFFLAPETLTGPLNLTGSTIQSLIDASWRQVSLTNVTACAISDSSASCPTQFSSAVSGYSDGMKGRYLIAAGMLGGNDDAFKFSQITMNVPSGGSGNVPIPGTAALIMIGLAGFTYSRGKPKGK